MARFFVYSILIFLFAGCADSQFLEWLGLQKKHGNQLPVAKAGENIQISLPENSVQLDGSLSADPDGSIVNFLWEKISGPDGDVIDSPDAPTTTIRNLSTGIFIFQLTVTDNQNAIASDQVQIVVNEDVRVPEITAVSPGSGSTGEMITITGQNLDGLLTISFNGVLGTIISSTPDQIKAYIPSGTFSGPITLTTSHGIAVTSNDFEIVAPSNPIYFEGNMDLVQIGTKNGLLQFNGWPDLLTNQFIKDMYLNNLAGVNYAFQQIITDPAGGGRNVMQATVVDDDPNKSGTSRAQLTITFNDQTELGIYHTSHRMYIHPDVEYIKNYPELMDWFSLAEIWNHTDPNLDGDPAGSARWGISIHKLKGAGQPLFWVLYGEYLQPSSIQGQDFWKYTNGNIPIPFGQWFTLDIFLKRGDAQTGKIIVTITPDGGTPQTIFDVTGTTMYPGRSDLWLEDWQPFKLYLDDTYLDWMRGNGKQLTIFYNDFRWYKD